MLSEAIFESLSNVGDVLRCLEDPAFKSHRARVLRAYAELLRVQWQLDTVPGSECDLANRVAAMSDLDLVERRAALMRSPLAIRTKPKPMRDFATEAIAASYAIDQPSIEA